MDATFISRLASCKQTIATTCRLGACTPLHVSVQTHKPRPVKVSSAALLSFCVRSLQSRVLRTGSKSLPRRRRHHPLTSVLERLRGGVAGVRPEGVDQLPVACRQRVLGRHQVRPPEVGKHLRDAQRDSLQSRCAVASTPSGQPLHRCESWYLVAACTYDINSEVI